MLYMLTERTFGPSMSASKGLVSRTFTLLGLWYDRHCERRYLAELTAERLDDIGLTVVGARKEASKPFWVA